MEGKRKEDKKMKDKKKKDKKMEDQIETLINQLEAETGGNTIINYSRPHLFLPLMASSVITNGIVTTTLITTHHQERSSTWRSTHGPPPHQLFPGSWRSSTSSSGSLRRTWPCKSENTTN